MPPRRAAPPRASLFMSGLGPRLAAAGGLAALAWLAVVWAVAA